MILCLWFLTMICLCVDYLKSILLGICWDSSTCKFKFFIIFERFSHYFFTYSFNPFLSLLSFWESHYVCAGRPDNVPLVSQLLYSFFIIIFLLLRFNHFNWLVFEFAESSANFSFQLLLRNFYFLYIISIFLLDILYVMRRCFLTLSLLHNFLYFLEHTYKSWL